MKIPFVNLRLQYENIKEQIDNNVSAAIQSFQFCRGEQVAQFEKEFADKIKVRHCIATGNGTDSLFLALKAVGIQSGDEVITPAFSWISSSETISLCGAKPVFVDVDPVNFGIDPSLIEDRITDRTKAIIAVHLYGHPADIFAIKKICAKYNLFLIEDCAQAHLSKIQSDTAGTVGHVNAFSFYPTKNLGAFGDAGCVTTNSPEIAQRVRRLANHGALEKDDHTIEGMNSRMDSIQAAVLLAKLPFLETWNLKRIVHAQLYKALLENIPQITLPVSQPGFLHTFHLFVIRTRDRAQLKTYLADRGVQTLIHYPQALPYLAAYGEHYMESSRFPVSRALAEEVLSLPLYPELIDEEIEYVCNAISGFYKNSH
jgi:dTDP-4-amino-4,6-dideoxygalactose transaminase